MTPETAPLSSLGWEDTRWGRVIALGRALAQIPAAWVGGILMGGIILIALFAPWMAPYAPDAMGSGPPLQSPSGEYWFGTDEFGRDLFSRIVYGSRLTLQVGLISVGISASLGVTVGLLAGYTGGWIAAVLMRLMDILSSFTETLVALAAVAVLGPSLTNAMVAVGISSIPFYARITYGSVLVEKNKDYFRAAQAVGARHARLILRHILPNILSPVIVMVTLGVSVAILSVSALSFLGLGAQPPSPEWGAMLSAGRDYFQKAPWITIFPGVAIVLSVLGFNLLGDALREALDPRQRR